MKDHAIELVETALRKAISFAEILSEIVPTAQAAEILVQLRKAGAALDVLKVQK